MVASSGISKGSCALHAGRSKRRSGSAAVEAVAHLGDGAAVAEERGEIDQRAVEVAELDPARPDLLERLALRVEERDVGIEADREGADHAAVDGAVADFDDRRLRLARELEGRVRHALAGALVEDVEEPGVAELAGIAEAIGDRRRRLGRRQGDGPAGVRAGEARDRRAAADAAAERTGAGRVGEHRRLRVAAAGGAALKEDLALDVVAGRRIGRIGEGDLGVLAADDHAGADLDARSDRHAGAGLGLADRVDLGLDVAGDMLRVRDRCDRPGCRRPARHGRSATGRLRRPVGKDDVADHLVVIGRRLLVADGRRQRLHLDLRPLGDLHQRLAGLLQFAEKGAREDRVRIVVAVGQAVERLLLGPGRHQHEHAFGRVDAGEAARAGKRARAGAGERVVATGVENQDRDAGAALPDAVDDALDREGRIAHEVELVGLGRRHVGRQEVIGAADLEAVAGVEEERPVAGADIGIEGDQRPAHRALVDVLDPADDEAEALERARRWRAHRSPPSAGPGRWRRRRCRRRGRGCVLRPT